MARFKYLNILHVITFITWRMKDGKHNLVCARGDEKTDGLFSGDELELDCKGSDQAEAGNDGEVQEIHCQQHHDRGGCA